MTDIAPRQDAIEKVLLEGDLSKLTVEDKLVYYNRVCESLGLNPLTQPFAYIRLNNKLQLYAKKDCADQLRKNNNISIRITERAIVDGVYEVTARATTPDGREDEDVGAVSVKGLSGDALANARMKATTKSKRRVTLSICGLGFLDELELETIPEAREQVPPQIVHHPAPKTEKSLEEKIADKERDWVHAGYCKPGWLLAEVRAWAARQGCDKPINSWPPELVATVGEHVKGVLKGILAKRMEPPSQAEKEEETVPAQDAQQHDEIPF